MFAVIYRGFVLAGRESEYKNLWRQIAQYFKEERGAIGSCLHQSENGEFVAYSRWPDRETRDASWSDKASIEEMPIHMQEVILQLKSCKDIDKPYEEIAMTIEDDLLENK